MKSYSKTWLTAAVLVLAALTVAVPRAQEAIHEEVAASRDATIEIDNLAGRVTVTGWDQDRVEVTGTLGRGSERLEVKGSGSRISIRVVLPEARGRGKGIDVDGSDLEVRVPTSSRLRVQTVSATVEVSGVEGEAQLHTVSGDVRLAGRVLRAEIDTVSGAIQVEEVSGLEEGDLNTVSGSLSLDAGGLGDGRYHLNTLSGSITVRNAGRLSADWEVSTFSGAIDNEVGPPAERKSRYAPGYSVSFSTGGGADVTLSSFSGRVTIRRD